LPKAVALFSGGLDSQLAVALMLAQQVEVVGVNFKTPFFGNAPYVHQAAQKLGIPLQIIDITNEYLELLKNPRYGFGKNINPCIDCHGLMLKKAGQYMEKIGADFIVTGEVLRQRPKSQHRDALHIVEKLSGYQGLILRPLSAKLLPPTQPELKGLVDRNQLLAISGRSRKEQMELADKFGLQDYPSPAGGCLLTVPSFASRLRRLLEITPAPSRIELERLKIGRHFISSDGFYLIVGRKNSENQALLESAQPHELLLKTIGHPGPTSLLCCPGKATPQFSQEDVEKAAALTARYSDAQHLPLAEVKCWHKGETPRLIRIKPSDPSAFPELEHL